MAGDLRLVAAILKINTDLERMADLAVNIAVGSSAQIGLFVAPVLVVLSFAFGPAPMALVFNGYELAALLFAALISTTLISDGESTWFEGVQLLGVYALLGLVFYYA